MNQEILKKWLAALRSGEFEQGSDQLHNPERGTHCCLGVLTQLWIDENPKERSWGPKEPCEFQYGKSYRTLWSYTGLPWEIRDWSGLEDFDPPIDHDDDETVISAIYANDNLRWDFEQIANALERMYLESA